MGVKVNQSKGLKPVQVVAAVIYNQDNQILIAKRKDGQQNWEFPGGKIELEENHQQALMRELKEELGIEIIEINRLLDTYTYTYPNKSVQLFFYQCYLNSPYALQKNVHAELKWISMNDIKTFNFLSGNKRLVTGLCVEPQKS
ncbi:MAG TPA: NUDIX domain-containing protein [Oligoflexia bacterium]|nr:NUDIX domain-containing protein [Oligoflexia bacterium]HMR24843.1 NUDIX domain-containing protein [Oligoflexia bacterium]